METKKYTTTLVLIVITTIASYAQATKTTERLERLDNIAYEHYNVDSTITYAQSELELALELEEPTYEAKAYNYLAWGSYVKGNYIKTCEYAQKGIVAAKKSNDKREIGKSYYYMGNAYAMFKDATKANEYYSKALNIFIESNDDENICKVLGNMAQMNIDYSLFDTAEECLNKAIEIERGTGNKSQMSEEYLNLGHLEHVKHDNALSNNPENYNNLSKALQYTQTARKLAIEVDLPYMIMRANINMADQMIALYSTIAPLKKDKERAIELHDSSKMLIDESYAICQKCGYDDERQSINNTYANWLINDHQYDKAEAFLDSLELIFLANEDEHLDDLLSLYSAFSNLYTGNGSYAKAYEAKERYLQTYISSLQMDYAAKSAQSIAEAQYEQQLRQKEIEFQTKSRVRVWAIYAISVILLLVMILAIVSIRNYKQSRKINSELDEKNKELEEQQSEIMAQNERLEEKNEQIEKQSKDLKMQNNIISENNKEMKDSINYAKVIQQATLPSEGLMDSIFGSSLVVYRPLRIVSGDFYWAQQIGRLKMLAVGDCTGHGVPGAFLSMLGISILNEIAANYPSKPLSAGKMLDKMRTTFKNALHQRGGNEKTQDGIDLALIILDPQSMTMEYAGAYRPIIFVRDGEAQKLEYDKMPIGTHHREKESFNNHTMSLMTGDSIYLFSDGMTDQFGYDSNHEEHKFGDKKLMSLLSSISIQPFSAQKTKIEMTIDNWRLDSNASGKRSEQTDDALIVGVRI